MNSIPNYAVLDYRRQSAPMFTSSQRVNKSTGKQETYHDIKNDAGYSFKMVTPPCNALFPHLKEGGNFGGKFSQTKETSKIVTNLLRNGDDTAFASDRADYFDFMAAFNESCLEQMYAHDVAGASTAIRAKTAKRYGKKKTSEEVEALALKAFKKNAMVPLKSKDGEQQLVIKCRAYNKDLSPRTVRYVQTVGDKYEEMTEAPDIRNGALLSVPFSVRPFAMSKDKYGLTYTLTPDIVVYSSGTGRKSASMEAIETVGRPYQFNVSEGKNDKLYLNINDEQGCGYQVRPVATEIVFSDLTGTGTLGRISGVTESNAKYTAVTKEDVNNPASVAFFDTLEKLQNDIIDYSLASDKLLNKLKTESVEEATEIVTETGESYDSCFRTVIADSFNGAVSKRDEDNYRQLRFSQNVFSKSGAKNVLPMQDSSGLPMNVDTVQRGALIAPVLCPSVYFMADGKFGLKLSISLEHGLRIDSNPEVKSGASGVLYRLASTTNDDGDRPAKRTKTD